MFGRQHGGKARATFGECDPGDKRRTQRLVKVAGQRGANVGRSLMRTCGGDEAASERAGRGEEDDGKRDTGA